MSAFLFTVVLGWSTPVPPMQGLPGDVEQALAAWRAEHGGTWDVFLDEETLKGRTLYNGSTGGGGRYPIATRSGSTSHAAI
jgi:hypothetical protein